MHASVAEVLTRYLPNGEVDTSETSGNPLLVMDITTAMERLGSLIQHSGERRPW